MRSFSFSNIFLPPPSSLLLLSSFLVASFFILFHLLDLFYSSSFHLPSLLISSLFLLHLLLLILIKYLKRKKALSSTSFLNFSSCSLPAPFCSLPPPSCSLPPPSTRFPLAPSSRLSPSLTPSSFLIPSILSFSIMTLCQCIFLIKISQLHEDREAGFDAWNFAILSQSFLFQVCSCLERNFKAIFLIFGQTLAVIVVFLVFSETEGLFPTKFIFLQIISSFLLLSGGRRTMEEDEEEKTREGKRKQDKRRKGGGGKKEGIGVAKEEGVNWKDKKTEKGVNGEDWKGIVEEFPTGVVILSEKREILFQNQILFRLLELEGKDYRNEESEQDEEKDIERKNNSLFNHPIHRSATSKNIFNENQKQNEESIRKIGEISERELDKLYPSIPLSKPLSNDIVTERGTEDHLLIESKKYKTSLYYNMVKKLGILEEIDEKESDDFDIFGIGRMQGSSSAFSELSSNLFHSQKKQQFPRNFAVCSPNYQQKIRRSFSIITPSNRRKNKNQSLIRGESKIGTSMRYTGSFGYAGSVGYEGWGGKGGGRMKNEGGEGENLSEVRREKEGGRGEEVDGKKKIDFGVSLKDLDGILDDVMKNKRSKTMNFSMPNKKSKRNPVRVFCSQFKSISKMNHRNYELKIQEIYYNEQPSFLLIIQDVSYRNIVTELRQNNDYKTKVLTALSHELRTPLNGAITPLETFVSMNNSVSNLSNLKPIQTSLKSLYLLQNVLGDVVDFALINSNQLYLSFEEVNVFEFLKETLDIFSFQAEEKSVDLSYRFHPMKIPPQQMTGDFQRIRQILVSLIGNALKNTFNSGFIEIEVWAEVPKISEINAINGIDRLVLNFQIEDSGIGIERYRLDTIRKCLKEKDLYEVCNSLNREKGCGVGLIISHCLALILGPNNNAGLTIDSTENAGTKVHFQIEVIVESSWKEMLSTIGEMKEYTRYSTRKNLKKDASETGNSKETETMRIINEKFKSSDYIGKSRKKKKRRAQKCSTTPPFLQFSQDSENLESKYSPFPISIQNYAKNHNFLLTEPSKIFKRTLSPTSYNSPPSPTLYRRVNPLPPGTSISAKQKFKHVENMDESGVVSFSNVPSQNPGLSYLPLRSSTLFPSSITAPSVTQPSNLSSSTPFFHNPVSLPPPPLLPPSSSSILYMPSSSSPPPPSFSNSPAFSFPPPSNLPQTSHYPPPISSSCFSLYPCLNLTQSINNPSSCNCEEALIVDDDAFNLKSLELILSKFGKKAVKAYNGDQAIRILKEKYGPETCGVCNGFKIIFMDYHMPLMNGIETTKVIRKLIEEGQIPRIPIIACTAFDAKDLIQEWEMAGMSDFLTKPITSKKIENLLKNWLNS